MHDYEDSEQSFQSELCTFFYIFGKEHLVFQKWQVAGAQENSYFENSLKSDY